MPTSTRPTLPSSRPRPPRKNRQKSGGGGGSGVSQANTTNSPLMSVNADPTAAEAAVMPTMSQALVGKMDMTAEYLNMLESRAKIKLNEMRANKMDDQDRMDFADYIKTLYADHRYFHVILAADFYRAIFNEGEYPSDLSNQVVSSMTDNGRTAAQGTQQIGKTLGLNNGALNAANQASGMMGGGAMGGGGQRLQPAATAQHRGRSDRRVRDQLAGGQHRRGLPLQGGQERGRFRLGTIAGGVCRQRISPGAQGAWPARKRKRSATSSPRSRC